MVNSSAHIASCSTSSASTIGGCIMYLEIITYLRSQTKSLTSISKNEWAIKWQIKFDQSIFTHWRSLQGFDTRLFLQAAVSIKKRFPENWRGISHRSFDAEHLLRTTSIHLEEATLRQLAHTVVMTAITKHCLPQQTLKHLSEQKGLKRALGAIQGDLSDVLAFKTGTKFETINEKYISNEHSVSPHQRRTPVEAAVGLLTIGIASCFISCRYCTATNGLDWQPRHRAAKKRVQLSAKVMPTGWM